jgi:hypothetical protein
MSRVMLVGAGPLPEGWVRRVGFPQLRTHHFAHALAQAGHEVGLVCLRGDDGGPPSQVQGPIAHTWDQSTLRPDWIDGLRRLARDFDPELWVSAGPHLPLRCAELVRDLPWWADLPGDPFAEAQARAARMAEEPFIEPLPARPGRDHAAVALAALERADAFSVCSRPQAHALLGQLGAVGRLALSRPDRHWAAVIPPAWSFAQPSRDPRPRPPGAPLVVALVGGFNTWLHEGAMLAGLLQAMDRGLPIRVRVTGGAIPGHHSAGWEAFRRGVEDSAHADRFELLGWVPQVDRPGAEPLLGSRTRLLFGLHQGLSLLATTPCALAADLAERGFLTPLPSPDPQALADALEQSVAKGCDGEAVRQGQRWAAEAFEPQRLAKPLLDWAAAPERAPAGRGGAHELSTQLAQARSELAGIYATPTWRLLSTLHGWVLRLLGRR